MKDSNLKARKKEKGSNKRLRSGNNCSLFAIAEENRDSSNRSSIAQIWYISWRTIPRSC
jgi:hypothetical protein